MSVKDIISKLTLHDKDGNVIDQAGNLSFKYAVRLRTSNRWNRVSINVPIMGTQPLKNSYLLTDDDIGVGHGGFGWVGTQYPVVSANMANQDWSHYRQSATLGTVASGSVPRVVGSIVLYTTETNFGGNLWAGNNFLSTVDLPIDYTQIGANIWYHPMTVFASITLGTTAGQSYVTYTAGTDWDDTLVNPAGLSLIRIETGADIGFYQINRHDYAANRLYLNTIDGKMFFANATATVNASVGPGRRAYFNEAGIIQYSTGHITTGGRYNPRKTDPYLRGSFIQKVIYDKSGSDETEVAGEQQGSYHLAFRPWMYGDGAYNSTYYDWGCDVEMGITTTASTTYPTWFTTWGGACNGMCLDWPNQRMFFVQTDISNGSGIGMWRWRTCDGMRELASTYGTAAQGVMLTATYPPAQSPAIQLAVGDVGINCEMGSTFGSTANWCYITFGHTSGGNAGVVIIKPDFSTLQYRLSDGVPNSKIGASVIDRSRARIGAAANFVTVASGGNCTATLGDFTQADVGRAIKITGGSADNGTYLIGSVASPAAITVTTLAGGAVTFTGGTGGTFEVGDRLYLFFSNATTALNKMYYMESLAPGTFLFRSVTFTGTAAYAAWVATRQTGGTYLRYGQPVCCDVDQTTGHVYWLSNDGVAGFGGNQQINKYDVVANTHTKLNIADVNAPAGGTGPITNITVFSTIKVSSKFNNIWVGTDQGHVRLDKTGTNAFAAASAKRYFGNSTTTYANPAGFFRSSGNSNVSSWGDSNFVRGYYEHADGRMTAQQLDGASSATQNKTWYSQENDTWAQKYTAANQGYTANGNEMYHEVHDPYGNFMDMYPSASYQCRLRLMHYELEYQWDAGNQRWFPLEVIQRGLPHKGAWSTKTDGATTQGSSTFVGTGFTSLDTGKYLTIMSGVDVGVYRVTSYTSSTALVLENINGSPFSSASNPSASGLSYSLNGGCLSKPIHSTLEETLYGVKILFNKAGGLILPNNQYLGRAGQSRVTQVDGTTSSGAPTTFTGSGFVVGDVGKFLKVETGANIGIYQITARIDSFNLTVSTLDNQSPAFGTSGGSLTYSIWEIGTPASNAGPETASWFIADGVAIDTNQDITGMSFETFQFKSRNYENTEGRKFCVDNPIAVPGPFPSTSSPATKVYFETYPRATRNWNPGISHHLALPGAELANGRQLLDYGIDKTLVGTNQRALVQSPDFTTWYGNLATSSVNGYSIMVDFGKDVEVGYMQARVIGSAGINGSPGIGYNTIYNGMIANVFKANHAGGAPVASSAIRITGGANLAGGNASANNFYVTTSATDGFLGPSPTLALQTDGVISSGGTTFFANSALFSQADVGRALNIPLASNPTLTSDAGAYRILAVSGDNKTLTIQNLNMTAKAWTTSASGVNYSVWDAVQPGDMLTFTIADGLQKLCVERLCTLTGVSSTTSIQVRTPPSGAVAFSGVSWTCIKPTWDFIKRLSTNTEAVPPDVANNKTWLSSYGTETDVTNDSKMFFDFTDLDPAKRTGRYWKFSAMPRGNTNGAASGHTITSLEFYDSTGKPVATSKYTWTDRALQDPDFYYSYINRVDFIQAANDAASQIASVNGNASLGGANLDTITLSGGNAFLGFQIGKVRTDGSVTGNSLTSASSNFPANATASRFIKVSGSGLGNNGYYRITSRTSATVIAVGPCSGTGSTTFTNESGLTFTVHEGINAGGTYPDKFVFLSDFREYTIATVSDNLQTITVTESLTPARSGATWEIRRPAYDTASATTEPTKTARLVRPATTYPVQSGDIAHDSRGAHRYYQEDIGIMTTGTSAHQRADGQCNVAGGFTGTGFTPDDVGRLLYILSGNDIGVYEIDSWTSSTVIVAKNHYTGLSVTFTDTATTGLTYQIHGDRRVRLSKYVTGLRA